MPQKKASSTRKVQQIDAAALMASRQHHPGAGRNRNFAADRLPKNFHTVIDPKNPPEPFRPLPPPTGKPPFHLSLSDVLSSAAMQTIQNRMVFQSAGDTGGVNTPTQIQNVAKYMETDFGNPDPSLRPSFFYHLGDVVYYDGELANYYPEFYEPYMTYPAPIFAIPGNHDGDVDPQTGESSLEGFVRNFCAATPTHMPEAQDAPRDAMTQPNVYWTLDTPLATFIGLYSNCPEGGQIKPDQIAWFESELQNAPKNKALIVAVHHPVYSAYGAKPGSQHLKSVLENACKAAQGRVPHLVLCAHSHNYQRFAGSLAGKPVPFLVAGAGGYNPRLHVLANVFHQTKLPIQMTGSDGTLESFCDWLHGYLSIQVTAKNIRCDYYAVPDPGQAVKHPPKPFDTITIPI